MSGKRIHIHFEIKQFLAYPDKKLNGMLEDSNGHALTADEMRDVLIGELCKGYDYFCGCDNRKSDGRCAGHPYSTNEVSKQGDGR